MLSHRKPGNKPTVNNASKNVKEHGVELDQSGPLGQVPRNMNGVHDSCPDDKTDCQDPGQLQTSSNFENKATTNVISRDVEMNHPSTVSATTAETEGDDLDALEKKITLHLRVLVKPPDLVYSLLPQ